MRRLCKEFQGFVRRVICSMERNRLDFVLSCENVQRGFVEVGR